MYPKKITGFDWDKGNIDKNLKKHNVTDRESEEVFNNEPFVKKDQKHSMTEQRFSALGFTNEKRMLFVTFTIRTIQKELKIRVISARDADNKEEVEYEKA